MKGTALAHRFTDATIDSVWNLIYKNHMSNETFLSGKQAVQIVLAKNTLWTVFTSLREIALNSGQCEIKVLWKSPKKQRESIAFPKGSPLIPFFKYAYNKVRPLNYYFEEVFIPPNMNI